MVLPGAEREPHKVVGNVVENAKVFPFLVAQETV